MRRRHAAAAGAQLRGVRRDRRSGVRRVRVVGDAPRPASVPDPRGHRHVGQDRLRERRLHRERGQQRLEGNYTHKMIHRNTAEITNTVITHVLVEALVKKYGD